MAGLGHFQQRAAAGLLHIIAVRGDGQNVERGAHFFLSTRKCAKSFSVWARAPNESIAEQPAAISESACFTEASTPKSAGYVAFSVAVSFPAVLPSCSEDWVTSSTSSTI